MTNFIYCKVGRVINFKGSSREKSNVAIAILEKSIFFIEKYIFFYILGSPMLFCMMLTDPFF